MDYNQLKADARQRVSLANPSPHRITCQYWLILLVFIALSEWGSYYLESAINDVSGISAIVMRNNSTLFLLLISFVVQVLATIWSTGYIHYSMSLSRGEENVGFEKITQVFRRFFSVLLLLILEYFLVVLWTCLFIIPGIVAAYRYRYALYILLENPGIAPMEAISRSKQMTRGYKIQMFFLDLNLLWYQILASVGTIVFTIYTYELLPLPYTDRNTYVLLGITYLFSMFVDILFLPFYHTTLSNAYYWVKEQRQQVQEP